MTIAERVAALLGESLDPWSETLCDGIEQMDEADALRFVPIGSFNEGTWAGVVGARLRVADLNPERYGHLDPLVP